MDQVSQIREKIDLVALIAELVTLKKAGRNFKANCPFHNEKSPSFVVSPERQIWHCFGCGKGGDCYTFLMEYEHLEFPEALRELAKRTGVELSQSKFETTTSARKESIYKLNHLAAEFYHFILTKHSAGKKALTYVLGRDVSEKVLNSFLIGFAPNTGDALTKYLLQKKKYRKEDLIEAGLVSERNNRIHDFFWGRIVFPLFDHRDNIVGFSGRVMDAGAGPKYINTRETLVYHKGDLFFGLNMTKNSLRKENQAIIVEGEFDVLACFQNGVSNVVAVKGTALTESQVNLLSRYVKKITICFDGDKAGQEAMKRSLPILEKKGINTTVVVIPGGKDPDEAIRTDATAFKIAVKNDVGIYDYLLSHALSLSDQKTVEGKKAIAEDLLPIFAQIANEIIKEHFLKKLSYELDTTYESLVKEIDRSQKKELSVLQPLTSQVKKPRVDILEEYLLALILQSEAPKIALEKAVSILSLYISRERAYQKILHHLLTYCASVEVFNSHEFVANLPSELSPTLDKCLLFPLPAFLDSEREQREIMKVAGQLKEIYLRTKIKSLSEAIKQKESMGENAEVRRLKKDFSQTVSLLEKN